MVERSYLGENCTLEPYMKKRNIAIFHYKVGGTDGVSLELDKWKRIFEEDGHSVFLAGGDLGSAEGTLIPEMFHHLPVSERLYQNTFVKLTDYPDNETYAAELYTQADIIEKSIDHMIEKYDIDTIVAQNVWSVSAHPSVALALYRAAEKNNIPVLAHHHDFYWERVEGVCLTCRTALELADSYLPPRGKKIRHAVINSLAKKKLLQRKGIDAQVIPNVFDFSEGPWEIDEYNRDLRSSFDIKQNDIVLLQATRVVARKGIEGAIDFAAELNKRLPKLIGSRLQSGQIVTKNSKIILLLAGYAEDDATGTYLKRLVHKAEKLGVNLKYIGDRVASERNNDQNNQKIYSLWDTYTTADMVTYPSYWEGWGNQFLEAVKAKLPIMLYEYPVYESDIADKGFSVISIGNSLVGTDDQQLVKIDPKAIAQAADLAVKYFQNSEFRDHAVESNLKIAREHYSMEALKGYLANLTKNWMVDTW